MTDVGELIDELSRYPRTAKISVLVEPTHFYTVDDVPHEIDDVEPNGCNVFDILIRLGNPS